MQRQSLLKSRSRTSACCPNSKNEPIHKVGDIVVAHFPPKPGQSSKLQPIWQGPYIVVQCRQGNTYRVKRADNFCKRIPWHYDQLRPFHDRPAKLYSTESSADAPILAGPKPSSPTVQPQLPQSTLTPNPNLAGKCDKDIPKSDLETGKAAVTMMTMFCTFVLEIKASLLGVAQITCS